MLEYYGWNYLLECYSATNCPKEVGDDRGHIMASSFRSEYVEQMAVH